MAALAVLPAKAATTNQKSKVNNERTLSSFVADEQIILAHEEIEAKTNEIPTAQLLMGKLGLSGCIFTFDALHCQKKR